MLWTAAVHKNHNSTTHIFGYCPLLILSLIFFFLDHNFQTIKAINSKLDTLMELIIEKCMAQEPQLCYSYLFDYCPLLNFILKFCLYLNFQTIKPIYLETSLTEHSMENSSAQEPQL